MSDIEKDPAPVRATNVREKYKDWTVDLIREDVQKTVFNYSALMFNWSGDFNQASLIRSGNAFGCKELFYYGKKKYDKRGSVGTHNYSLVTYIKEFEDFVKMKEKYSFIGIDNNHNFDCVDMFQYDWKTDKEPLLIFGEEGSGLTEEILLLCDKIVYIKQFGSVPSLNVASCATTCFYDLINKRFV